MNVLSGLFLAIAALLGTGATVLAAHACLHEGPEPQVTFMVRVGTLLAIVALAAAAVALVVELPYLVTGR